MQITIVKMKKSQLKRLIKETIKEIRLKEERIGGGTPDGKPEEGGCNDHSDCPPISWLNPEDRPEHGTCCYGKCIDWPWCDDWKRDRITKSLNEQSPITTPMGLLDNFAAYSQQMGNVGLMDWRCMKNMRMWLISIFSLQGSQGPIFSAGGNPNMPCQYIQNKINQLQTWINNFSGNPNSAQLAKKQCKLQVFQQMLPWAQQLFNC
jgi:hypothetical protein